MLISGHKTRSIFDRYNIIDERDFHTAGHQMEKYFESQRVVTKVVTIEQPEGDNGGASLSGFNGLDGAGRGARTPDPLITNLVADVP
jgi:hypothetical protein